LPRKWHQNGASQFLQRVAAMLRIRGYGHVTDSDVQDVAQLATCGLVHQTADVA
jgi:hypothetical protein